MSTQSDTKPYVWLFALIAALALMPSGAALAQSAVAHMPYESAFVDHRLTIQLSDAGADKQALVLSVANNVLKFYGPDAVAIEIVAFGPGVDLLRAGNPNEARIESLVAQGVRFDVCMNTIAAIERKTGKKFPLNPQAHKVTSGVVQMITLSEHGYTAVRP